MAVQLEPRIEVSIPFLSHTSFSRLTAHVEAGPTDMWLNESPWKGGGTSYQLVPVSQPHATPFLASNCPFQAKIQTTPWDPTLTWHGSQPCGVSTLIQLVPSGHDSKLTPSLVTIKNQLCHWNSYRTMFFQYLNNNSPLIVTAQTETKPGIVPGISAPPAEISMNGSIISFNTTGDRHIQDCKAL